MSFVRLSAAALAAAIVLGLPAAATSPSAHAQPAGCAGNLLKNPSFEAGSHKTESIGTSLSSAVGDAWVPWFVRGNARDNREPEFKVEQVAIGGDAHRVRSGSNSQKYFTTWGTHTAGFYQRVNVRPGATLTFGIYGMAYTGEADGWNGQTFVSDSERPGNYEMMVGIDPSGAIPSNMGAHPPASVVWSPGTMTYDEWVWLTVSAQAKSGVVTVYTKGAPQWAVKHNDSFWDDACLMYGGAAKPAPAAVSGAGSGAGAATGSAPATASGASASTASASSAAVPSGNSYVVVKGDTLSRIARLYKVTVAALTQANKIANPRFISVGQTLVIPGR